MKTEFLPNGFLRIDHGAGTISVWELIEGRATIRCFNDDHEGNGKRLAQAVFDGLIPATFAWKR